ncbi:hypothetical protein [Paenarthrobacter sp. PH39-S1]|uniref:hypothetical protein n=1 Tax=Paenarthrobacter sp. PH39-S1 TaxID=3046204 RepID=UPI0024BB6AE9|nr:hypothetical protein [Paenarthrobacter sp. PH39-S1]MDJ0358409.1 hypothetical protein [Paenarthrobacter sp. PH39-S1]
MSQQEKPVHVVRVRKSHTDKHGQERDYRSAYLRRSFREGGKVRNETVANLSALPDHVVDLIEAGLKGQHLIPADAAATILRSRPHGHVAAVTAQAKALGLPALLGPACPQRDLALAKKHLSRGANPDRLALFDLSSSWVTGHHCPLAARGYSRDGKKGLPQIEYGLLTDPEGRPVSVRVVPGNTADPTAFEALAKDLKTRYGLLCFVNFK